MKPNITSLTDPQYQRFKDHVNSFKQTRYYLIDFVAIGELRKQGKTDDEIADAVAEYCDDQEESADVSSNAQTLEHWPTIDEETEKKNIIEDLCGGPHYGHTEYAMQSEEAEKIWNDYFGFFNNPKTIYSVNLGSPEYTFMRGVLIVDDVKAGVLNIVQDD